MYIIRTAFWLSVVILLIPGETEDTAETAIPAAQHDQVSAGDAVNAALSTFGDLAGLCARRPEVCETGAAAWDVFQRKALTGVGMIYRWTTGSDAHDGATPTLTRRDRPQSQADASDAAAYLLVADNSDPIHTGTAGGQAEAAAASAPPPSQNTLRLDDLIPAWGGAADEDKGRA
jgi:hypothetical protein